MTGFSFMLCCFFFDCSHTTCSRASNKTREFVVFGSRCCMCTSPQYKAINHTSKTEVKTELEQKSSIIHLLSSHSCPKETVLGISGWMFAWLTSDFEISPVCSRRAASYCPETSEPALTVHLSVWVATVHRMCPNQEIQFHPFWSALWRAATVRQNPQLIGKIINFAIPCCVENYLLCTQHDFRWSHEFKKGLIIQTYCFYQNHYDFFIIIRTTTSSVLVNYLDFF